VEPLLAPSVRHATGDWGFSFASRINVDTLIQGWLPTTLIVIGAAQHSTTDPGCVKTQVLLRFS